MVLIKYTSGGLKGQVVLVPLASATKLEKHGLAKILKIYEDEPKGIKK